MLCAEQVGLMDENLVCDLRYPGVPALSRERMRYFGRRVERLAVVSTENAPLLLERLGRVPPLWRTLLDHAARRTGCS